MEIGDVGEDAFEIAFTGEDGVRRREPLPSCWTEHFEKLPPIRKVSTHRGKRSVSRDYWAVTTGGMVPCESHLERHHAMMLDFDPLVTALSSQQFRLFWPGRRGRRGHVPDLFARRSDGGFAVVDVRPDDLIEPDDAEAFAATARACELAGWEFRRIGCIAPVLLANVNWLAGYRHPRHHVPDVAARLAEAFAQPATLMAGVDRVGDRMAVLPVLYHLLWRRVLDVELETEPLSARSLVKRAARPGAA